MLKRDEQELKSTLQPLPAHARATFAAACAERLAPEYSRYLARLTSSDQRIGLQLLNAVEELWNALCCAEERDLKLSELVIKSRDLLNSVPDEQVAWETGVPYAHFSALAAIHALRSSDDDGGQCAVWASRAVCDAIDFVISREEFDERELVDEARVLQHTLHQSELERQAKDIETIQQGITSGAKWHEIVNVLRRRAQNDANILLEPVLKVLESHESVVIL